MHEEAHELAAAVRALVASRCDAETLMGRVSQGLGADLGLFGEVAELGVVGLAVSEHLGGQGAGLADLTPSLEVLGQVLAPIPVHSTSVTLALLRAAASPAADAVIEDLCTGPRPATVALAEAGGWQAEPTVRWSANGTVTGAKQFVLDADVADTFVVSANRDDHRAEPVLLGVRAGDGVRVRIHDGLDLIRSVATVTFEAAEATELASGDAARSAVRCGLAAAALMLAAEQVGVAQACLDMAVEYAGVREQFGQPIGVHQAIKHPLADLFTRINGSRALTAAAASAVDEGDEDAALLIAAAAQHADDTAVFGAQRCIQVHGGIGYTFEHPAHLYLRRARSGEALYASPAQQRERLVELARPHQPAGA